MILEKAQYSKRRSHYYFWKSPSMDTEIIGQKYDEKQYLHYVKVFPHNIVMNYKG